MSLKITPQQRLYAPGFHLAFEDELQSPPNKKPISESPASAVRRILRENDPSADLIHKTSKELSSTLDNFARYEDTSQKPQKAEKIHEILQMIAVQFGPDPKDPKFHLKAYSRLHKGGGWVLEIMSRLKNMPLNNPILPDRESVMPHILNLRHIAFGDANGGAHYFHPEDPGRTLIRNPRTNPQTQVMCGTVMTRFMVDRKFSSFFPDTITSLRQLMGVISGGQLVARWHDRLLYQARSRPSFHLETILAEQKRGQLIATAYPIISYVKVDSEGQLVWIGQRTMVRASTIRDLFLRRATRDQQALQRYEYDQDARRAFRRRIVDIAPLFSDETQILNGIYIDVVSRFPQSYEIERTGAPQGIPLPGFIWRNREMSAVSQYEDRGDFPVTGFRDPSFEDSLMHFAHNPVVNWTPTNENVVTGISSSGPQIELLS